MIKGYYIYWAIAILVFAVAYSIVLTYGTIANHQDANAANIERNSTSTVCVDDKPCITTVCINDEPCHTLTSNSTTTDNSTSKRKLITISPQENV